MNPEFRRNLWLELTPRRIALMVIVLALIFFAAAISGGKDYRPASVAETLYYLIVVFWGSRNAALSVVGEIRDRTWDMQRLSSIAPGAMTWGKLFGSTIYNWFGGGICLAVILAYRFTHDGPAPALLDLVYFVEIGVIAQAAALLASLIAVNRRQRHSRLEIFIYQLAGLLAALGAFWVWEAADPESVFRLHAKAVDAIAWWGQSFGSREFLLVSLAAFTAWILIGCYREMRLDLKMTNGPLVWFCYLVFIGLYVAGFDAWLTQDATAAHWHSAARRLALAATTYGALTYIMVLLEPKDRVLMRWIGAQLRALNLRAASGALQSWMMAWIATLIVSVALILWLGAYETNAARDQALAAAMIGFVTRDTGIFVLAQSWTRRRGDFSALVTLLALYVLIPAILNGLGMTTMQFVFFPKEMAPLWLTAAAPWAEAVAVWAIAIGRLSLADKEPRPILQTG